MKKTFLSLLTVGLLIAPMVGLAVGPVVPPEKTGPETLNVLDTIVNYVYGVFLVIAVLCIILAAYIFVTAAGDPEKVNKARNYVLYALVGVLIAVLAKGLVALVKMVAGVPV